MTRVALVVAAAENGVIGASGGLPWRLRSDLRKFRAVTMGKPIVMGRRTFDAIGRVLDGRLNIVVSREAGGDVNGAVFVRSWPEARARREAEARATGADEICVIGGGQIYAQSFDDADRIYLTRIQAAPEGDTHFPEIRASEWSEVGREALPPSDGDTVAGEFVILDRMDAERRGGD